MSKIFIDVLSELTVSVPEDRLKDQAKSSNEHGFHVLILIANTKKFFFFFFIFIIWTNHVLVLNNYLLELTKQIVSDQTASNL